MKILLLTGVKEELEPVLEHHSFEFIPTFRVYRSTRVPDVFAATTGPGVKKAGEIRKFLKEFVPDVILNAGLVGILNPEDPIQPGELLKLKTVISKEEDLFFPGGPGRDTLITVEKPVFEPWEKYDLYYNHGKARACDMEAAKLLRLVGSIEKVATRSTVIFCKVAGDRPDDYTLYQDEHLLRSWSHRSVLDKVKTISTFPGGYRKMKKLQKAKRSALDSLYHNINLKMAMLMKAGEIPSGMDSVFIPH